VPMARLGGEGRAHTHGDAALKWSSSSRRSAVVRLRVQRSGLSVGLAKGFSVGWGARSPQPWRPLRKATSTGGDVPDSLKGHARTKVGRRPMSRLCALLVRKVRQRIQLPGIGNRLVLISESQWFSLRRAISDLATDGGSNGATLTRRPLMGLPPGGTFSDTPSPTGFPRPPLIRLMRAIMLSEPPSAAALASA
jgi:hypothetical protein